MWRIQGGWSVGSTPPVRCGSSDAEKCNSSLAVTTRVGRTLHERWPTLRKPPWQVWRGQSVERSRGRGRIVLMFGARTTALTARRISIMARMGEAVDAGDM